MKQTRLTWRTLGWPVYLVLALLVVFVIAFVIAFAAIPTAPPTSQAAAVDQAKVDALLKIGNAADAESIIESMGCPVCHRQGAENGIAPSWVGIAARAATRRPGLSAAAYLYQSITNPSAFVVPGYTDVMPKDFAQRMSDQQLADVMAYLLTPDAK